MAKEHILIIEDEEDLLALVHFNLSREGYRVSAAQTGEEGLELARQRPDLVLLDLMLPGVDGLEVCRRLRQDDATRELPIVMMSARGEEADVVRGLELGADDYVTKPFSIRILLARVAAVLRRRGTAAPQEQEVLVHGELEIHPGRNEVLVAGRPVSLTYTEFRVLHLLASRPGWVFTRGQIVNAVRGEDHAVTDRAVDVQIVGLRRKLGACGGLIETVRGVGYRFREPGQPAG
ncbi:two-component system phosphate regulon response regulator PhoB [Geothermobacter ehrlichii]|uniref:Two-component system phosphate regulon response regulator PhoB n=1 Tax=Geothermobacter ehrlichii TaxID=213224 RepID=A0A5D3WI55_9BACT|nr:response regulator transcription factor [Geothermobacter ehrlichii]TYO98121.1 two-component system phosphate regulon response regulator PhoB [Geothermobacter ehrlichii]